MSRDWLRIIRWTGIGVAVVACLLGLALLFGYAFVQSDGGRAWLSETLNRQLSGPGATQVRIGRLAGDLPGRIELHDVSVADADGVWLRLKFIAATWRPAALLTGKLSISTLDADGLTVLRGPEDTRSSARLEWSAPPLGISVERFSLNDAVLEQPLLGERVAFRASGSTAAERPDRIHTQVELTRTDGVSGQATLEMLLQPRAKLVRFQLALDEADGGVIARALDLRGLPSLSIRAEGEGPLDALRGDARLRAGNLVSAQSNFNVDATRGPAFSLSGRASVAELVAPPFDVLLNGDVAFEIQAAITEKGIRVGHATAASALAKVELFGEVIGLEADFHMDAALGDLRPLSGVGQVALQGQASASAHVRSEDLRRTATVSFRGALSEVLAPEHALRPLVGPQLAVTGTLAFEAGRQWALSHLQVTGSALELSANATVSADMSALQGDYRLLLPALAVLSDAVGTPLQGTLRVVGNLSGSPAQAALSAQLSAADLSLGEASIGAVRAKMNIMQLTRPITGDIALSIDQAPIGPAALSSRFSTVEGDRLRLDGLTLESRGSKLEGAVVVSLSGATANGSLTGQGLPLAPWSELAGRALSGSVGLVLDLSGKGATQKIELGVTGQALNVALAPNQLLQVDALDVSARVDDAFATAHGSMRLLATGARAAEARFASVALELQMDDPGRVRGRLHSRGEMGEPFELEVVASYAARERGFVVGVSQADAHIAGQAITLSTPARIQRDGDTTELSRSTISVAGGRLSVGGRVASEALQARLELDSIELAVLEKLVPMADFAGTLSGHASVSGSRRAPIGELELKTSDLRSAHTTLTTVPPVAGRLGGEWRDGRLQLEASFAEIAETRLVARASVPLRLDPASLGLSMPADEALDGTLRWSGELGPLWELLSPYEDRFTGSGDLALELAGSVKEQRLDGHFQVAGGRYENVLSGTTLTEVELRLVGSGEKLVLEKLSAADGHTGKLEASGIVDFLPAQSYPVNLRLDFSDMLLIARDDLTLNAGGHLTLQGTLSNALLAGEVVTGQSELSLAGTLPPEVVELDVREINSARPLGGTAKDVGRDPRASDVVLDLDISVPGRAFVRGLGLDSEWQGNVKISGNTRTPNVAGVLSPVRGQFSLMGKSFKLERGTIRFTGSDDVDPLLDLTAEHATSGLTAMVRVTGSASRPKIALTSRPPLPESDIASQILFGTNSSNLTPGQSLQLASAIATFSGSGGAVGILDTTRRALGVDVINFAESEQNPDSTRVSVGKYVTDGVYIEVERGAEESSVTSATVEVEVLPDVRLEGGTTETGGNKVGIKWKWDY